jgi:hypothetical protein
LARRDPLDVAPQDCVLNDEQKARDLGIRAAHGQAVSIKAQKGKSYRVLLRASDGLSIVPDGELPPRKTS